jgi:hypothetical protein
MAKVEGRVAASPTRASPRRVAHVVAILVAIVVAILDLFVVVMVVLA